MSRKRATPASDFDPYPNALPLKKHLNAALASELDALRISQNNARPFAPSHHHIFGAPVASSPFLASAPSTTQESSPDVSLHFNNSFADSLVDASYDYRASPEQEVVTPGSPSSSASMEEVHMDASETSNFPPYDPIFDEVIVEELQDEPDQPENRLVVYRPPLVSSLERSPFSSYASPRGRYTLGDDRNEQWVRQAHHGTLKRKLAVVPWKGDTKKICNVTRNTTTAIPMKWYDTESPADQTMEIEDVS